MSLFMSSPVKEPLVEAHTKEVIARRGAETIGVILVILGILFALLMGTYTQSDPSLFNATDDTPQNMLGIPGAFIADLIHRAFGWAGWGLPVVFGVWGLRFIFHKGDGRVLGRLAVVPFAIAIGAVFAAAHAPLDTWTHDYGLGGWFGDAVLGGLVSLIPINLNISLITITLVLLATTFLLSLVALGATIAEVGVFFSLCLAGIRTLLRSILRLLGWTGVSAINAAKNARRKRAEKRGAINEAEENPDHYKRRLMRGYGREAEDLQVPDSAPVEDPAKAARKRAPLPEYNANDDNDEALMARITAAVAARETGAGGIEPPISEFDDIEDDDTFAPEIGGVTRDDPIPSGNLDLPPVADTASKRGEIAQKVRNERPRPLRKSVAAKAEEQPRLALGDEGKTPYIKPPLSLLSDPSTITRHVLSTDALEENARMLENVLDDYGVKGEIVSVRPGPVVTMYELEPAAGLKASRVIGLADDIARSMSALAARVSTIPGRSVIGIELPNDKREVVLLREILSAAAYGDANLKLPLALGKDISGEPVVANLSKMPHLLIAGTTGSGKSVAINTMILSLLYQLSPEECRLIMIDPKMLELSVYDGIPHLLSPVVTDPKKAVVALKWVVAEMEERYRKMSKMGVRNIDGYNGRVKLALAKGEGFSRTIQTGFDDDTGEPIFETEEFMPETMPYIVVIVDEMADLMMVAGKEIEACIQRLAQMARASGIHLIMATQRPSVDVITGTIKANFPTRISFQVTSKIDSRTILGEQGSEQLLGQGDMLHMAGGGRITRVHGPFVSDEEVEEIVTHLKSLGAPEYVSGVQDGPDDDKSSEIDLVLGLGGNTTGEDALYDQAVAIVARDRKCSTSYIQRKLSIGYNKAARLVEQMEDEGVVSQANHVGKREILVPDNR